MKFLLTNDDGIDSPGLEALYRATCGFGDAVVAAPTIVYSAKSHCITTDRPIAVQNRGAARYAVDGSPADCVRVALHDLVRDADWVLAGINLGGNLGADVHYSGTVAAVREAALHGFRGIAFSHYRKQNQNFDWDRAIGWVEPVLRQLLEMPVEPGDFWNVNLPCLSPDEPAPQVVFCPVDFSPLPLSFRREEEHHHYDGDYHNRRRAPGSDVDVCFSGNISVSKISIRAMGNPPV